MDLSTFLFPVTERPIAVNNGDLDITDWNDGNTFLPSNYKALVREDTNETISIVRKSYQMIRNEDLIESLMTQLEALDTPSYLDESHSFADNRRMRLQITFPELTVQDQESEIALSLFMSNSYDGSMGVRMIAGAIRFICTNGMVVGNILESFYSRHTKGFRMGAIENALESASKGLPNLQETINYLDLEPITQELVDSVREEVGVRLINAVDMRSLGTRWELYNALTEIISHKMKPQYHARYQANVSKVFGL